ncbi:MAG: DUF5715 family protein [Pyrinomonadaceae bacterium]
MKTVLLKIESGYEEFHKELEDELTIGRAPDSDLVLPDSGLSRKNTTIFRDRDEILIVDEGSTNGTFINGERISGPPKILLDGDVITAGNDTRIVVSFDGNIDSEPKPSNRDAAEPISEDVTVKRPIAPAPAKEAKESKLLLYLAGISTFLILILAGVGLLVAAWYERSSPTPDPEKPQASNEMVIPVRVIDPLGRQKQEDLDELVQYWEVQEKEVTADDLKVVSSGNDGSQEAEYYNVSLDFWKQQREKAYENPDGATGIWPAGLDVPSILRGDGVVKQKAKIREMQENGYKIPMDFADLAEKRNQKLLVEMPMATETFVLEVGGSSTTGPFTTFNFDTDKNSPPAQVGSPDFNLLANLASNFSGIKYDMNNGDHRRQMKIRLLRMFNPRAKLALEELAKYYYDKYKKPLRVTSLQRSMEYQISLNKVNPNSFPVRGPGSLPPHTSGCAFDLARKHMGANEQNYLMKKLEEMEKRGVLDALIEGNVNACFHVFVYEDGIPPKGY